MAAALHAQNWVCEIQPIIEQHSGSANQWRPGSQISETIHNGSRGTNFAKFLISKFLKGLTYSAVYAVIEVLLL